MLISQLRLDSNASLLESKLHHLILFESYILALFEGQFKVLCNVACEVNVNLRLDVLWQFFDILLILLR